MMSHHPELLSAMLDGELSEEEGTRVSEHLEGCGACRAELDDLAAARAAVRSLPMLDLPEGLVPHLAPVATGRWRGIAASAAAVAAVALGAVGVLGMTVDSPAAIDVSEVDALLAATSSLDVEGGTAPVSAFLTSGADARYSARQTTMCRSDRGHLDHTVDVTRLGGVTVVTDLLTVPTVLAAGSASTGPISGPIEIVTVRGAAPALGDYELLTIEATERRDRPTNVVTLGRDGAPRANLWIDQATGVVVSRELLDDDGSVACVVELVEFEPIDVPVSAAIPFDITAEVSERVYEPISTDLPGSVGGMALGSAYAASGGVVGIYGDGLFTIAVVRAEGSGAAGELARPPSSAVMWEADGVTWAVVGALPDDRWAEVRDSLPPAGRSNVLVRGWRAIFG